MNDPISLGVTSFEINEESIEEIPDKKASVVNSGASIIKTSYDNEANNILVCYTKDDNHSANCVTYNLDNNEFSSEVQFFSSCKEGLNGMQVYYFSRNKKYMLICSDYSLNKGFHVIIFDDININEYTVTKTEPDYMYGGICNKVYLFNIILLLGEEDNEYVLINDCEITDSVVYTGNIKLELLSQDNNYPNIPGFSFEPETEGIETYDLETVKITPEFQYISEHISEHMSKHISEHISEHISKHISEHISEYYFLSNNSNIIIESSTKSKEEIMSNINDLINDKDPKITYVINGEDYTVIIKPIDEKVEDSTVNIDFTECENVLKEEFPYKEFRILQINIENEIENNLVDQVEYKIYDENGEEINLSNCNDLDIIIEYKIKNVFLLDVEQISYFKNMDVDIFNLNNEFFNDICFSYSDNDTNSDMILKDRVEDIYQNFSICGDGCEYISFNSEKMSANCNCTVKQELSLDPEKGNFKSYIMSAFLDLNFGVIKCYNLVFSFAGKLKNAGFWIFGAMVVSHIPMYILYLIKGTTTLTRYINKEMDDKGYNINKVFHDKQKSKNLRVDSTTENLTDETKKKKYKKHFNKNPPKKKTLFLEDQNDNYDVDVKNNNKKYRNRKNINNDNTQRDIKVKKKK